MNERMARKLAFLRQDFQTKTGTPFRHFYCPILFRDEDTELARAHIVNQAFDGSARRWTVQRSDVDGFYGSMFEADFVILQDLKRTTPIDALLNDRLSRLLRPIITANGDPVQHYRPTDDVPSHHSEITVHQDLTPAARLAFKLSPDEMLARASQTWEVGLDTDLRLAALVALIKSAHLTMFELLGYEYGLSAAGRFVGHDILGSFYTRNLGLPKETVLTAARSHFSEFRNLVRPVISAPSAIQGTISDNLLYLCTAADGFWAFMVLVRTGPHLHAVLLPVMEDEENAARFVRFLTDPAPTFEVKLVRFMGAEWHASPTPATVVWPAANFD